MNVNVTFSYDNGMLQITASGNWTLRQVSKADQKALSAKQEEIVTHIRTQKISKIFLSFSENPASKTSADPKRHWGSLLLAFFCFIRDEAEKQNIPVDISMLSSEMQKLLEVTYNDPLSNIEVNSNPFYFLGNLVCGRLEQIHASMNFVGDVTISLCKFFAGKASVSAKDVWQEMYNAGAASLPIISLVSLLLGLILAFVSAVQLQVLGAEVYVSSLVTVSMVRVMSPVLTGIVIAGRIGASYAATIGSMQVNEEVDALETFGIQPVEFLVLPRFLALSLMMPFLTVYSDFMGILGGYLVIFFGWDISFYAFLDNVQTFANMQHIFIGLFHSFVFGILIALSGCYQGIVCGRDAEAVGKATTMAVVHSIIGIIVSTSVITIILSGFNM